MRFLSFNQQTQNIRTILFLILNKFIIKKKNKKKLHYKGVKRQ